MGPNQSRLLSTLTLPGLLLPLLLFALPYVTVPSTATDSWADARASTVLSVLPIAAGNSATGK
jgi:hypothetical protein